MGKRPEWVWIARESGCKENWYYVSPFQKCRIIREEYPGEVRFYAVQRIAMCPSAVHRVLGIRLKPGEGPVRVKFTAELVRD